MSTQRTDLLNFLRATSFFDASPLRTAKLTGFMVSGIRDSADLWQEAQDAYGRGADGLMEVVVDYATLAAACYEKLVGAHWVDEREPNVETYFLWVIEEFGQALAELIRDSGSKFDVLDGNNLLFERITNWLIPEKPAQPSKVYRDASAFQILIAQTSIMLAQFVDHFEQAEVEYLMMRLITSYGPNHVVWDLFDHPDKNIEVEINDQSDRILVLTTPGDGWLKIRWSSAHDLSVTWAEPKS